MEGDRNVLKALDTLKEKFRVFALASLDELQAEGELKEKARLLLSRDIIIFLPKLQQFVVKYEADLAAKNVNVFLSLLPVELGEKQFPAKMVDKAFLFARVFQSLMKDLSGEEEGDEQ